LKNLKIHLLFLEHPVFIGGHFGTEKKLILNFRDHADFKLSTETTGKGRSMKRLNANINVNSRLRSKDFMIGSHEVEDVITVLNPLILVPCYSIN
tara:strand:- start:316 stop:600 length:285 start_codon:yes stop_codon:yes gene_type:complete